MQPDTITAASLYESLTPARDQFLRRAEKSAALTIPMLVPRNGGTRPGIRQFDTPRQGVGARGVNHLSSRLLLTMLPTNSPFFKLAIDPFARAELAGDEDAEAEVEATLRMIEDTVHMEVNSQAIRVTGAEIFKHLIVAGNVLQYLPRKGGMQYFPLSQYVVVRDPEGDEIVDIIIKECVAERALPLDVQALVRVKRQLASAAGASDVDATTSTTAEVDIFTRVTRVTEKKFRSWQELADGTPIAETFGTYTPDTLPFRPLRWVKVQNEAYGRGLVEEYLGDLLSLEALAKALVEGALAAARVIGLVRPNSQTHPADLNKAKNGEFIRGIGGDNGDVSFLQLNKHADFRTAAEAGMNIQHRMEQAFLLASSISRNAERVTAEEIRLMAQELESTLGGVYTILAHEFQLPLVRSILARLQKEGAVPHFPPRLKKIIKPVIVTGMDALGRNAELERMRVAFGVMKEILPPEVIAEHTNVSELQTFIFAQAGVTIKLTKTAAEVAEARQVAQRNAAMQGLAEKAAGPAINAVSAATQAAQAPTA